MTATLIGIVSWGAGCGYAEHPDIYGRVTHVLNWIELNTGKRNTKKVMKSSSLNYLINNNTYLKDMFMFSRAKARN